MEVAVLERALQDDPDDAAAWHAYADALAVQGDPRGALIRLEHRRRHVGPADAGVLAAEIAALTEQHRPEWDAELPPGVHALTRRHGFAVKVGVEWSEGAPGLIAQALQGPFVTGLRISPAARPAPGRPGDDEDTPGGNGDADRADGDGGGDGDEDGEETVPPVDLGVFAELDLGRLAELDLSYLPLGESGTGLLAEVLTDRLTTLDLRYCGIGDAGLAAFSATARLDGLRRLRLQCNGLTADGVRLLWLFDRLTDLDLRYNALGEEGAKALVEAPFAPKLKRLFLNREDIGDEGVDAMLSSRRLPPLLRSYWRSL